MTKNNRSQKMARIDIFNAHDRIVFISKPVKEREIGNGYSSKRIAVNVCGDLH
jgi:hypothetical protein